MWQLPNHSSITSLWAGADRCFGELLTRASQLQQANLGPQALGKAISATPSPLGDLLKGDTEFTKKVRDLLRSFSRCADLPAILAAYQRMTGGNYQPFFAGGANAYRPTAESTKRLLSTAADFFYAEIHKSPIFQAAYGGTPDLPERYRKAWTKLRPMCPYCDISLINFPGSREIDHLLAKRYFPLLAAHGTNLVVCCKVCNQSGIKGQRRVGTIDGKTHLMPMLHPFFDDADSVIRWQLDFDLKTLKLGFRPRATAVQKEQGKNFNDLFRLEGRYRTRLGSLQDLRHDLRGRVMTRFKDRGCTTRAQLEALYDEEVQTAVQKRLPAAGHEEWKKLELDLLEHLAHDHRTDHLDYVQEELETELKAKLL
ncbi:MAG TPA: hypothetical protein VK191_17945 [Symbiobacteriaceae bacterium]|nr:hypothetical protein [Symbiobacteriaceae bacterium]